MKGLLKLIAVLMVSVALAVVSLVYGASMNINTTEINTAYVREIIIPNYVEKDWDDSFYIHDEDDIAQIVQAVNALELRNAKTYTEDSFQTAFADFSKEDLLDLVAFQYDVEQKDQIAFLEEHKLPVHMHIMKDGRVLVLNIVNNERCYKTYQTDAGALLTVLDEIKTKYREMIFEDDVMQALRQEGIRFSVMWASDTFEQNWPNTTILRLNDMHYLLLRSFPMDSEKRMIAQNECGWIRLAPLSETAKNAPFILDQIEEDFLLEDIDVVHVAYLDYKNMAAQLIPIMHTDMTSEERDALSKENVMLYTVLERIFSDEA